MIWHKKILTEKKSLQYLELFLWAELNRTALHCDQRGNAMFQKKRKAYIIKLNLEFVITMNLIRKKDIWTAHAKSWTYEWCLAAAGQPPDRCYWFFFVHVCHKPGTQIDLFISSAWKKFLLDEIDTLTKHYHVCK